MTLHLGNLRPVSNSTSARSEVPCGTDYWKHLLEGFHAPTPLLNVAPPPGAGSPPRSGRASESIVLPERHSRRLPEIARHHQVATEAILAAAWAVVLGRHATETDVVFGVHHAEDDGTYPVRAAVDPNLPATRLLQALQAQLTTSRTQACPSLAASQAGGSMPPVSPLFTSVLAFGEEASYEDVELACAFPLLVRALPGPDVELAIHYDRARFDDGTSRRILGHWQMAVQAIVESPEIALGDVPILTPEERQQILVEWNATRAPYPADRCIHQLFEAQAQATPEAIAVFDRGRSVRYGELNAQANRLAHHLRNLGVQPGALVGICLRRSVTMIEAVLAVLKAGATYVPLDPSYPRDRLAFMLEDTQASVLLTQTELRDRLPDSQAEIVCLDAVTVEVNACSDENLVGLAHPNARAYIIYTSGSTGRPKGVILRHAPVVNLIDWVNQTFHVGAADRLLFVTSLNFDLSVYDIFGILGAGGSVRIAVEEELRDPQALLRILADERITFWDSAPPQLQQVATFFPGSSLSESLRLVFLSGDWIPVPLPDAIRQTFPNAQVVSLGGATEAAIWSNFYPVGRVDPSWPSIPYGKPIRNARYHILDAKLRPVPVGVPGELHIGGDCLADGYLNRPELTAERFIPDPFSSEPDARLYKTGDLARYFPDGNIEFLGRLDNQVKIRGFRIELGEIESVLAQHPQVREAVVLARSGADRDKYLVGYVVPSAEALTADALRSFLLARLPEYMVPAHLVFLEALPLNPNGKIDRKALPEPERETARRVSGEAPRNEVEESIACIWQEVLGHRPACIHESFFALGGHSLTAAQVVARVRQRLGAEVSLPAFFEQPTIAGLAGLVHAAPTAAATTAQDAPQPGDPRRHRFPTSAAQRWFWLLDQMLPDRSVYNIAFQVDVDGTLDPRALREALDDLSARHATLRTTFAAGDGAPEQVIADFAPIDFAIVNLRGETPEARNDEAKRLALEAAQTPFDLARGPVWRALLLQDSGHDRLVIVLHHIVTDAWSMHVLFRDLFALYRKRQGVESTPLPALPVRYADYSDWQQSWLQGPELARQMEYWQAELAKLPSPLMLPADHPPPRTQSFRGAVHSFTLSPHVKQAVEAFNRREGVTPFTTLLTAFAALLGRYCNEEDLLIGTPLANRHQREVEDLVGVFINALVIRADLSGRPTFRDLLARIRQRTLGAFANPDVPFDRLVEALHPDRAADHQTLFQVMFIFYNQSLQLSLGEGLIGSIRPVHNGTAKFDLTLAVEESAEESILTIEYNRDRFEPETVERMAGHFETLLRALVEEPDLPLDRQALLTDGERMLLLDKWNDTAADYPRDIGLTPLLEEQAAKTPDHLAVECGRQKLTYGELNARANQLAHHLRRLGVGPGVAVGLCVERSADMLVGLLGILKAGGAYVPLDPEFPRERLDYYIRDSRLSVLVTHQRLGDRLPASPAKVVALDTDARALSRESVANPEPITSANDLAYVIYTSGSTGQPKGVQVLHGGLVNFLCAMRRQLGIRPDDTLLAVTTLSFDMHVTEVWLPLLVGARVVIASPETAADGSALGQVLEQTSATFFQATPATYRLLLSTGWQGKRGLTAITGGEALTVELAEQLLPRVRTLWNGYGPTETTVYSTLHLVSDVGRAIPIGRPIDNTQIYLLDQRLQPVPIGIPGEVYIAGSGLARGYLGKPDLSAERFIANPFQLNGSRMYRTGDLARYRPDGTIDYLGRLDHQVKIRGFRVELGEVETALVRLPEVASAVVVAHRDADAGDSLVAYLILEPGCKADNAAWRQRLLATLPDYMVPTHFVPLEEYPLTPNGKVDRKALAARAPERRRDAGRVIIGPRNDVERDLLSLWEEVLRVHPISVTDNFFDLGGHSFAAALLVSKVKETLGHTLPLGLLLEAGTVERMSAVLQHQLEAGSESCLVPLHTQGSRPPLFLIAGVGGHVFTFHKFARLLGSDQPSYGVKAIGVDGTRRPPDRLEEIAAQYLEEILAERPNGPYLLGGYSIGALVAYELALQMQARGLEVGPLVVFDRPAPCWPKPLPLPSRLWVHFKNFCVSEKDARRRYLSERLQNVRRRVYFKLGLGMHIAPEIEGVHALPQDHLKKVWVALQTAQQRYQPRERFRGGVILFKAEDAPQWSSLVREDPLLGWRDWATGTIEQHVVPGEHLQLFHDRNIDRLASTLRGAIDRFADQRSRAGISA